MQREQVKVLKGMTSAGLFSLIYVIAAMLLLPKTTGSFDLSDKLAFAIRSDSFAVLTLLAGVARVATLRFFSETAISGQLSNDIGLEMDVRYIQNTLEQFLLLLVAHLTLATFISSEYLHIIPILVSLFIIGRICFWVGYHKNPTSRAFGFAATFYPTVVTLLYCLIKIVIIFFS